MNCARTDTKTYSIGKSLSVALCLGAVFSFLYIGFGAIKMARADENLYARIVAEVVEYWEAAKKKEARVKALVQADMMAARTPSETAVIEQIRNGREKTKSERKKEIRDLRRQRLARRQRGIPRGEAEVIRKKTWRDRVQIGLLSRAVYDDNIFLRPKKSRTRKDLIIRTTPVLGLDLGFGKVDLDVIYVADVHAYLSHERQSRVDHVLRAHGSVPVMKNLTLSSDYELRRAASRATSEDTGYYLHTTNTVESEIYYDIGKKFAFGGEHRFKNFHYSDHDKYKDNYRYHRFIPTIYYKYSPKTSLFFQMMLGRTRGGNGRFNSTDGHISVGVRGRLSKKIVSYVNVGLLRRKYSSVAPDLTTPMVKAMVLWGVTPKDTVSFIANWDSEQTSTSSNYYVSMSAYANLKHEFSKKISASGLVGVRKNFYPTLTFDPSNIPGAHAAKRKDDFLETGVSLRYDFKDWLYAEIAYRLRLRRSNFANNNYTQNEFTAGIGGEF